MRTKERVEFSPTAGAHATKERRRTTINSPSLGLDNLGRWFRALYARKRFVLFMALVLILSAILVSFQKVNASGTLDQQQPSHPMYVYLQTLPSVQFVGQTFTAGLSGSLTEVDLVIMPSTTACKTSVCGPVTVEIHSGSPTGPLLASTSLPSSALPDWFDYRFTVFSFSTPAQVAAGSVYAIVISTTYSDSGVADDYYKVGEDVDVYAGGQQFLGYNGPPPTVWSAQDQFDIAFKTYVAAPTTTVSSTVRSTIVDATRTTTTVHSATSGSSTVGTSTATSLTTSTITSDGTIIESVSETDTVYAYLLLILGKLAAPVGGFVESVHKQAVLDLWLVVIGLLGFVAAVVVIVKKRSQ